MKKIKWTYVETVTKYTTVQFNSEVSLEEAEDLYWGGDPADYEVTSVFEKHRDTEGFM